MMELDSSKKDVEVYPMTDGQLLVLVDGLTHTTYMQESADSYRYFFTIIEYANCELITLRKVF